VAALQKRGDSVKSPPFCRGGAKQPASIDLCTGSLGRRGPT